MLPIHTQIIQALILALHGTQGDAHYVTWFYSKWEALEHIVSFGGRQKITRCLAWFSGGKLRVYMHSLRGEHQAIRTQQDRLGRIWILAFKDTSACEADEICT